MAINYVKPVPIVMKGHQSLNERWIQDLIVQDPSILGLGDVFIKDKERVQPRAGRLDLLLQSRDEDNRRYEVEIQLGATDESHIVRCIEYYDFERRRFPAFEHCAVLVAEDITSRFLNVISLFNGFIPLIAIQMKAMQIGNDLTVVFSRVVDELNRDSVVDDDSTYETTDRRYWEKAAAPEVMAIVDRCFELIRQFEPRAEPNYNKGYVGVKVDGKTNNFATFSPKSKFCRIAFRLPRTPETDQEITAAGIDLISYTTWGAYQIRVSAPELKTHERYVSKWLKAARDYYA